MLQTCTQLPSVMLSYAAQMKARAMSMRFSCLVLKEIALMRLAAMFPRGAIQLMHSICRYLEESL